MNITLHLSGIGHRRFCGADAAEQAERWAHDARRRIEAPSDDEAEAAAAEKLARITSTRTARAILTELKRYSRANTLEFAKPSRHGAKGMDHEHQEPHYGAAQQGHRTEQRGSRTE